MIDTAEVVAKRYGIGREICDEYAPQSQLRVAEAQKAHRFDAEIVPLTATMKVVDKATGAVSFKEVTLEKDEGNRPDTTLDGLSLFKSFVRTARSPPAMRASCLTAPPPSS